MDITMNFRQLIFIALIIGIIVGNSDATNRQKCSKQLKFKGNFKMDGESTDAFNHAFYNLIIPADRRRFERTKEILFKYMDHLRAAGIAHISEVLDPITWCCHYSEYNDLQLQEKLIKCGTEMESKYIPDGKAINAFERAFNTYKSDRTLHMKKIVEEYYSYIELTLRPFIVPPIALNPQSFCQYIGQQPPPSIPAIQEMEDGNTSNSQPDVNYGRTSVRLEFDLNDEYEFDLNKEYTGE